MYLQKRKKNNNNTMWCQKSTSKADKYNRVKNRLKCVRLLK